MQGKGSIRFVELFRDTVECHGLAWAVRHYKARGMEAWEVVFWLRASRVAA